MNAKKLENNLRIFSSGDVQNTSNLEWLSARELVLHVSKTSPIFFYQANWINIFCLQNSLIK